MSEYNADEIAVATGLAEDALVHWGMEHAALQILKFRENAVFKISLNGVPEGVIRIHRQGYHTDAEVNSELLWMGALDDAGIHTPRVIPALDGANLKVVKDSRNHLPWQCDVLAWVDGDQLDSIEVDTGIDDSTLVENYVTMGELAARIHNQATSWTLPDGFSRQAWNLEGLVGKDPIFGRFWELEALSAQQLEVLQRASLALRNTLEHIGENPSYYSLIHADLLPENLLVTDTKLNLIDFDDCGFGWHLFEFATPLFFHLGEDVFDDLLAALVQGYRKHRDISDEHLAYLPAFILARGLSYLGWLHSRRETETAKELAPMIIEAVMALAEDYLENA